MGIVQEILVFLNVKGKPEIEDVQRAMMKLGYNLRLTGRDLMRMGGSLRNLSKFFMGFSKNVFSSSDIVQDALGDVQYALLDVAEASGFLDTIVNALEWLADTIEAMPILGQVLAISFAIGLVVMLLSKIFMLVGFMRLLVGAWLSARTAGLGFGGSLKFIFKALTGQLGAWKKELEIEALAEAQSKATTEQKKKEAKATEKSAKAKKKETTQAKKSKRGLMGILTAGVMAIGVFAGMALAMGAMGPIMEATAPIWEALGEVFEWFGDLLEETGIIDWIADFIRNNKELVISLLLAFAALPLIISGIKVLGPLIGKLTDKLGGLTKFFGGTSDAVTDTGGALDKTGGGFNKTLLLIAAILPSLVLLVHAFIDFLKVVKETGISLDELFGILEILVLNLGEVVAIVTAASKFLGQFQEIGWSNIIVLGELLASLILLVYAFADFVRVAGESGFTASELAGLITALSQNLNSIIAVIGAVTYFLGTMKDIGWEAVAMVIALGLMTIGLVTAFTRFLEVAASTGFQVGEIVTILDRLTIAVIGFIAAISIAVIVMAALVPAAVAAAPIVAILLGIGAAAFLIGAGFLLAGLGVKFAAEGIALLIGYVPQVLALGPALFGVAAGMFAVGSAGLVAAGGIAAFAGSLFLLSAALTALMVPLGIVRALGGPGAVLTVIEKIPMLEKGGIVTAPGLAYLHPNEAVTPAKVAPGRKGYQPKEPPLTVSVDVTGVSSIEEIVQRSVEASVAQISEIQERKYRRSEY